MSDTGQVKSWMVGQSHIEVGRYTYGHENISIKQWDEGARLRIGAFCSIAEEAVVMLGGNHRSDWITTFPFGHIHAEELGGTEIRGHPKTNGDVTIGNDVWLGRRVTIMSGITIADGAIVAANSTVIRDIGPYEVWGGNPAQKIRSRFAPEIIELLLRMKWWDYDIETITKIAPLLSQTPDPDLLRRIESALQG